MKQYFPMYHIDNTSEFEAETTPETTHEVEPDNEVEAEMEALERLARAGHWQRCLAHAGHRATHYALRYAAYLFKAHPVLVSVID